MANRKDKSQASEAFKGYSGLRWLSLNGNVVRRLVYVFGDLAFVMPDPESPRGSRTHALVLSSQRVHKTEADAIKGEVFSVYMVRGYHANMQYKKVLVKGSGPLNTGHHVLIKPNGETESIHGRLYANEQEAVAEIRRKLVEEVKEHDEDIKLSQKHKMDASKILSRFNRRAAARKRRRR
jgi:hypothetical protein